MDRWKSLYALLFGMSLAWFAPSALAEEEGDLSSCLGRRRASPHRRKGGESFPPLPLPATPLRRTEKKRPPAPPTLIVRVKYGAARAYMLKGERVALQDWNTDPAALQILLKRARGRLGIEYKDEVLPLGKIPEDPAGSLILFFTGQKPFDLPEETVGRIRSFLSRGGYLWCDAGCGMRGVLGSYVALCAKLFPDRPLRRLPPDHPVFRCHVPIEKVKFTPDVGRETGPPVLLGVDLGCRTAVFVFPYDLTCGWEGHTPAGGRAVLPDDANRMGLNLLAYSLGYAKLGRFLSVDKVYVDQDKPSAGDFVFGQVRWDGNWDPDPTGPINLLKEVGSRTSAKVRFKRVFVKLTSPNLFECPFLYMTGHEDFTLSDPEIERLRAYLRGGGFLFADACCGRNAFAFAFEREMKRVLPDHPLENLPADHPVLSSLHKIGSVEYTATVRAAHPDLGAPALRGIDLDGSTRVIFSPFDFGNGWEGVDHPWTKGLAPADALRIGVNIIVYAMTH